MGNQQIRYGIGFDVDNSGLQKARQELRDIEQMTLKDFKLIKAEGTVQELNEIKQSAKSLQDALEDSFNPKLGTVNVEKFSQSLKNIDIKRVETQFAQLGAKGSSAFRNMTAEILTTQREIKQTSNLIDSMAKTLGNTIKWSIASSAINTVTGKIQEAWGFTKKLDASLNDIRIVTGKSADEMERFAKQSNKAAKDLGAATTNYTNAALIYYQQGLDEKDVVARSNVTVKAANVTGQSASEVSEQLTAVWNGYKVVAEEAELYVDKLAAVAATTAADLEELSTGMSKVASAAHTMGVDVDQLSAQLATIVSVTRQDANVVGTALKTIYARMGDLKVDGVDEFGTSLGDVSSQMQQMGINVLDETGNLRDMGEVIEEVAAKWGTWTDAQQQAAAVAIAGKRQYNNLIALFENWDMYESSKSTSSGAAGTLQKQQDIYMDSLEARLQRLGTAGERVFDAIFDSESMKDFIDGLTIAVDRLAEFVESIGGGGNLLLGLGSIATRVFSSQIATGITRTITNLGIMRQVTIQNQAELEILSKYSNANDQAVNEMIQLKKHELQYAKLLTEEQKQQYEWYIKQTAEKHNQLDLEKLSLKDAEEYAAKRLKVDKVDVTRQRPSTKRVSVEGGGPFESKDYVVQTGKNAAEELRREAKKLREQAKKDYAQDLKKAQTTYYSDKSEKDRESLRQNIQEVSKNNQIDPKFFEQEISKVKAKQKEIAEQLFKDLQAQLDQTGETLTLNDKEYTKSQFVKKVIDKNNKSKLKFEGEEDNLQLKSIKQIQTITDLTEKESKAKKDLTDSEQALAKNAREAIRNDQVNAEGKTILRKALDRYNQAMKEAGNNPELVSDATVELQEAFSKALENTADKGEQAAEVLENMPGKIQKTESGLNSLRQSFKDFAKQINTTALVEGFVTATSAVGQFAAAMKSVGNLNDIWDDESLALGEKVSETVMAVSSAIGMLTFSYKSLRKGIAEVVTAMNLQNTTMGVMLSINQFAKALDKEQNDEKRKLIISRFAEAHSIKLTEEELEDLNKDKTTELILDKLQDAENSQGGKNLEFREKGTKNFDFKSIIAKGGGIKSILGRFLKVLGPIAIIVTSVLTVIDTVKKAVKNDSDLGAEALSNAAETAQVAKENVSELTQQYTELKNALEDHTAAQKAIDDLITGTQEWKDAVRDANMEVLDLLDKYPTLAKYIKNANGRLIITNEGSEAVLEAQEKAKQNAYQTSLSLQAMQKEAENNREIQQGSADTFTKNTETKGAVGGAAAGALGGAAAVALASTPIGWVAGAIIAAGAAIGSLVGHMQAKEEEAKEDEAYEKAIKALEDHGSSLLVSESKFKETLINQYGVGQRYVDALWENKTQLAKNYEAIQANTAALQIQRETGWKDYLGQYSEEFKKSKYQDEIVAIFASQESDAIDLQKENIISSVDTKGFWNFDWGDEIRSKKEIRALADLFQQEDLVGFESTYDVDKQNKRVTFTGTDGQTKTLSIDSMVNMLAAKYNKTETSESSIQALNNAIETLISSIKGEFGDNIGQSLADAIAGKVPNLANLGQADFNALDSKIAGVIGENGVVNEAAAASAFGFNTIEAFQNTLSSLGYKSITDYINKIKQGLDNYQIELDQLGEGLFPSVKTAFDSLITNTLPDASLQIQKSLQDSLKIAFSIGGEEGVAELQSALSKSNFTEEEFAEFFNLFNNNDWGDFNAWDNFVISLEEAGYGSLFAAESWSIFMDSLKDNTDQVTNSAQAVAQFGNALESLKEFKSIEIGSLIDKATYDQLIKDIPELRNSFIDLGNNKYMKRFGVTPQIELPKAPSSQDQDAIDRAKEFFEQNPELEQWITRGDNGNVTEITNPEAIFDFLLEGGYTTELEAWFGTADKEKFMADNWKNRTTFTSADGNETLTLDEIKERFVPGGTFLSDDFREWSGYYFGHDAEDILTAIYNGTDLPDKYKRVSTFNSNTAINSMNEGSFIDFANDSQGLSAEEQEKKVRAYIAYTADSYEQLQELRRQGVDASVIDEFTQTILAKEAEQLGINLDVWENYSKSVNDSAIAQDKLLDQLLIQNLYEEADALALIDDQLEQVNNDLDDLKDAKEKAYGTDVLENLQQQIEKEEEIAQIQAEKYERNNRYLAISKNNLSELYNPTLKEYGSEYQIKFDENGLVTNESYDAILALASQAETKQDQEMFLSILTSISDYNGKMIENQETYDQAMQDKVNNALDLQLEQNKYLYDIKNSFYDLSKQINDLNRTFGKWDGTIKSAFEEESVSDIIANAEQDFNLIYDKYINTITPQINDLITSMVTNVDDYNVLRDKVGFAEDYDQEALQAEVDKYNENAKFYLDRYSDSAAINKDPVFEMKDENGNIVTPSKNMGTLAIDAIEQSGISQSKLNAAKILTAATLEEAEEIVKEIESDADAAIASAESKKEQAKKDVEAAETNKNQVIADAENTKQQAIANATTMKDQAIAEADMARDTIVGEAQERIDSITNTQFNQLQGLKGQQIHGEGFTLEGFIAAKEAQLDIINDANAAYVHEESKANLNYDKDVEAAEKNYQESVNIANDTYNEVVKMSEDTTEIADATIETANSVKDSAADALEIKKFLTVNEDNPYVYIDPNTGKATMDKNAVFEGNEELFADAFALLQDLQAELEKMYEAYFTAQEQIMSSFDKLINRFSSVNDILSTTSNLWKILKRDAEDYYTTFESYYVAMQNNTENMFNLAEQKYVAAQIEYDRIMADQEKYTEEMIQTVTDNLTKASSEYAQAASDWIASIGETFQVKLQSTIDQFVKAATGLDLMNITEKWELTIAANEDDLDQINAAYAWEQFDRNVQKSIDETNNINAQNKLIEMRQKQEEKLLAIGEKRNKISQYEIDHANAVYELTLKQIALEEAQNTSSKMKLTRDAMGNYSYQYIQDEDAIAKAEEELAAAQNELYNLDKERNQTLVEEYYSIMAEANTKIAEAVQEGDKERAERLKEYYFGENGILRTIQDELSIAQENLNEIGTELGGEGWTSAFAEFTEAIVGITDKDWELFVEGKPDDETDGISGLITSTIQSLEGVEKAISSASATFGEIEYAFDGLFGADGTLTDAISALTPNDEEIKGLNETVGTLQTNTQDIVDKLGEDEGLIKKVKDLSNALSDYAELYQNWLNQQVSDLDKNTNAINDSTRALLTLLDYLHDQKIDGEMGDFNPENWVYNDDDSEMTTDSGS